MGIFEERKKEGTKTHVPVWFMRQAGRYHSHYQDLKKKHDFMTLCKDPDLACEVTMGPIRDFGFDAAIMFSDLLFPLEQINMGLSYKSGPPTLEFKLEDHESFKKLKTLKESEKFYQFQAKTLEKLKIELPADKTLLGFVGAPFTLYTYAVEGAHKGNLVSSKKGLYDGRFKKFLEILRPLLLENISVQLNAGADAICLFDTAVGELSFSDYERFILPELRPLAKSIKEKHPDKKVVYYSKHTHIDYLKAIESDHIDVLGIDWRMDIVNALKELSSSYYIQGNIDPVWLHLENKDLIENLNNLKNRLEASNLDLSRWVAGLGHGVLIQTPEENVRSAVKFFQSLTY